MQSFFRNITVLRSGISTTPLKMSKSIPDRWIPYKACGKVIEGTRIVCFKVPLRKGVQEHNKAIKEIWDIKTLLDQLPKLGAVVDLTNTARYYNPAELRDAGVLHKKILMPGRVIPPEDKVTEFMDTIDEFLGKDCDTLIGVHCTHGLNRTGYMVCRYMRDRLGIQGADAITRFEEARGYKIERENYIADILGEKVPPPDVGKKNTTIKPIDDGSEQTEHISKLHNNRWRHHNQWRNNDQTGYNDQSGYNNRSRYNNRSGHNNRSEHNNRSGYGNRSGHEDDSRSDTNNRSRFDKRYDNRSMQYKSPLDQNDDTEHHEQSRSNGSRSRFSYNPYSRNRDGGSQKNNTNSSGTTSSRWDISGISHKSHKPHKT